MNTLIGLLIIAIGSFGQSSSYVPINKVKNWSWESFWLVQGIFAWLVFPLLGALLAIPAGSSLLELWGAGGALPARIYGVLWGVGGLTGGVSMRYLGVALGQSIALGTCAGFGTLFPALFAGKDLLHGEGLMLLIGVCITLAGIAIIGYAGSLRSKNMTEEEKRAAVKDIAGRCDECVFCSWTGCRNTYKRSSFGRWSRSSLCWFTRNFLGYSRWLLYECYLLHLAEYQE